MMQRFQQMRGNMPQGGAPGAQGGAAGAQAGQRGQQGGQRDTAAFRRMMQNNPEMRQRMQNMRSDTSARRRNLNQQGQGGQTPPPGTPNSNQN